MINLKNILKNRFFAKEKKENFIIQTFLDLILLFKSFIHWNVSKMIIVGYSIVIGFISILPLVLIFFIYSSFSDVDITMLIQGMFLGKLLFNFIGNIILILIIILYFIVFSYSNILLFRLNNNYIDGKKINYKNEVYFDYKRIFKYLQLSLLGILILLLPFVIFSICIGILFLFSGNLLEIRELVNSGVFNYFTVLSLIFLGLTILTVAYLYYKIVFSFLLFSDDTIYSEDKKIIYYLKKSFDITKGIKKILKFLLLIIIFITLTAPFNYIGTVLENNSKYYDDYIIYLSLTEGQKSSLEGEAYYDGLKSEFIGLSIDDINKKSKLNLIYTILYSIFNFIFIYGLFIMLFSSFYKRELK